MKFVIGRDFDKEITDVKDYNVILVLYQDFKDDFELEFLDVMGNITEKYKNHPDKKLKFTILNFQKNEPRDIEIKEWTFPKAYLYTNTLKEKKLIKFTHKNETHVTIEEFENFLNEKLKIDIEDIETKEKNEVKIDKDKEGEKDKKGEKNNKQEFVEKDEDL